MVNASKIPRPRHPALAYRAAMAKADGATVRSTVATEDILLQRERRLDQREVALATAAKAREVNLRARAKALEERERAVALREASVEKRESDLRRCEPIQQPELVSTPPSTADGDNEMARGAGSASKPPCTPALPMPQEDAGPMTRAHVAAVHAALRLAPHLHNVAGTTLAQTYPRPQARRSGARRPIVASQLQPLDVIKPG